ncbi:MAG: hypothetical protein WC655_27685 [Candidatus Hydrogenedentales bacterium]|jgi:hypothetical protein
MGKISLRDSVNLGFGFGCGCLLLIVFVIFGIPALIGTCSVATVYEAGQQIDSEKAQEQREAMRVQGLQVVEQKQQEGAILDTSQQILDSLSNGMTLAEVEGVTGTESTSRVGSESSKLVCKWSIPDGRVLTVTFKQGRVSLWKAE